MPDLGRETRAGDRVLSIRLPGTMVDELVVRAGREERSVTSLVRMLIRQGLTKENEHGASTR